MKLYALSDLHIRDSADELYLALCNWIEHTPQNGDHVVLAGDIFDLYVGNKKVFSDLYERFFQALRDAAKRGVKLHTIEGNHDFEIAGAFKNIPSLQHHPEKIAIEMEGKKILIEHGDLADKKDWGYRILRGVLRSLPMKAVIATVPGAVVLGIGGKMREWSEKKRKPYANLPKQRDLVKLRKCYRNYALERMKEDGFDFVILGHCHDLDEMGFKLGGKNTHYMNIGYPRTHQTLVTWAPGEEKMSREAFPADGPSSHQKRS